MDESMKIFNELEAALAPKPFLQFWKISENLSVGVAIHTCAAETESEAKDVTIIPVSQAFKGQIPEVWREDRFAFKLAGLGDASVRVVTVRLADFLWVHCPIPFDWLSPEGYRGKSVFR
jgi:hypothetical protein